MESMGELGIGLREVIILKKTVARVEQTLEEDQQEQQPEQAVQVMAKEKSAGSRSTS